MLYQIDFRAVVGVYTVADSCKIESDDEGNARQQAYSKARFKFKREYPHIELEPEIELTINKPKNYGKL